MHQVFFCLSQLFPKSQPSFLPHIDKHKHTQETKPKTTQKKTKKREAKKKRKGGRSLSPFLPPPSSSHIVFCFFYVHDHTQHIQEYMMREIERERVWCYTHPFFLPSSFSLVVVVVQLVSFFSTVRFFFSNISIYI